MVALPDSVKRSIQRKRDQTLAARWDDEVLAFNVRDLRTIARNAYAAGLREGARGIKEGT
jgi:hypothetical protein